VSVLISKPKDMTTGIGPPTPSEPINVPDRDWFAEGSVTEERRTAPAAPLDPDDEIDPTEDRILDGLLRMADTYRATDSLRQAMEMYFALARNHDGSTQAADAVMRLLDVAREYEDAGELRQARGIYEHLLRT
jgi:hypothetical protein